MFSSKIFALASPRIPINRPIPMLANPLVLAEPSGNREITSSPWLQCLLMPGIIVAENPFNSPGKLKLLLSFSLLGQRDFPLAALKK